MLSSGSLCTIAVSFFFFFKQKTAYEMRISDWSSDVCSSDLTVNFAQGSAVMLGAVLGYTFMVTLGWPFWLAVPIALAGCALLGLVVERALVRPDRKSVV